MKRAAGLALFQKSVMGLRVREMPMTGVTLLPQTVCVCASSVEGLKNRKSGSEWKEVPHISTACFYSNRGAADLPLR